MLNRQIFSNADLRGTGYLGQIERVLPEAFLSGRSSRYSAEKDSGMGMEWLDGLVRRHILTPERIAENEMRDTRLLLFQAERQLLEAEMRVGYHRNVLIFLEAISAGGVEGVAAMQRPHQPSPGRHGVVLHQIVQEELSDAKRAAPTGKVIYEQPAV